MKYFRAKTGDDTVTLEVLVDRGKQAHGRTVWVDGAEGREEHRFDYDTGKVMTADQFGRLQKQRAEVRRGEYERARAKRGRSSHSGAGIQPHL